MEDKKAIKNVEALMVDLKEIARKYELFTFGFIGMMGDPVGEPDGSIIPTALYNTMDAVYLDSVYTHVTKAAFNAAFRVIKSLDERKIYEKTDNVITVDSRGEN